MTIRLNLGCGLDHKPQNEGWINVDINPEVNPDMRFDLNDLLVFRIDGKIYNPFSFSVQVPFNNVNEILIKHCLEHLKQNRFFRLMNELWELCQNNAIITIIVPYWLSEHAFEPDHKWVYPPRSFKMITESSYSHLITPAKFEIVELIEKDDAEETQTICKYRVIK